MERELWTQLYGIVVHLDNLWTNGLSRAGEIVMVFLWAVVPDRPTCWACQACNWAGRPPRWLPSQSATSRRLRTAKVRQLLSDVEKHLGGDARRWWLTRLDSKPLPVGPPSKDPDAKYGYAGRCGLNRGYKLHAIWGGGPGPCVWRIETMSVGDATAASSLVRQLPGEGYVVADSQYDSNPLHAAAAPRHQLVAPPQRQGKALGHRRHHPSRIHAQELVRKPFGRGLLRFRDQIERDFSGLTSFAAGLSPLPSWVRRLHRVRLWLQAKLLIYAVRLLQNQNSPLTAPA
jgi:hypothetical protein